MSYKKFAQEFADALAKNEITESKEIYWLLRLLFEINGNLDSIAADLKEMKKSNHDLAAEYAAMLKLQEKLAAAKGYFTK